MRKKWSVITRHIHKQLDKTKIVICCWFFRLLLDKLKYEMLFTTWRLHHGKNINIKNINISPSFCYEGRTWHHCMGLGIICNLLAANDLVEVCLWIGTCDNQIEPQNRGHYSLVNPITDRHRSILPVGSALLWKSKQDLQKPTRGCSCCLMKEGILQQYSVNQELHSIVTPRRPQSAFPSPQGLHLCCHCRQHNILISLGEVWKDNTNNNPSTS